MSLRRREWPPSSAVSRTRGEHEQRIATRESQQANGRAQKAATSRATGPRQKPSAQTERPAANDPDDHLSALSRPANCRSSSAVAHARVRGGPHSRADVPRGASVVRPGLEANPQLEASPELEANQCRLVSVAALPVQVAAGALRRLPVAQPRASARQYSCSQRRRQCWRAGNRAPRPSRARAGWLKGPGGPQKRSTTLARVLHLGHRGPFSAVDFGRGALKRRKHRTGEPVISSRRLPGHSARSLNTPKSLRQEGSRDAVSRDVESARRAEIPGTRIAPANPGTANTAHQPTARRGRRKVDAPPPRRPARKHGARIATENLRRAAHRCSGRLKRLRATPPRREIDRTRGRDT